MQLLERAIWFIEWRRETAFERGDAAAACGISRNHLARVFQNATGRPVMAYVRARRLSEAARRLAGGEGDDILGVAIDAGYSSHEAFTRAFRAAFGTTPEAVRPARCLDHLDLTETLAMDDSLITDLAPPRFADRPGFSVAGLAERFSCAASHGIPTLWRRFAPHFGAVPGQVGMTAYGVCHDADGEGFTYLACVETDRPDAAGPDLVTFAIPPARYAIFTHSGHIAGIRATTHTIWSTFLPESGLTPSGGPDFELYDGRFDPATGTGIVEIWIPLADDPRPTG
jgi:AraC family transcriptional regulator